MSGPVERAQAVAQEFSDLVREVETTNPDGALLIVQAMETATRSWQTARQTRTDILNSHLGYLAAVLDAEPDATERTDLWTSACRFVIARSKANFQRTYGKRVEDA